MHKLICSQLRTLWDDHEFNFFPLPSPSALALVRAVKRSAAFTELSWTDYFATNWVNFAEWLPPGTVPADWQLSPALRCLTSAFAPVRLLAHAVDRLGIGTVRPAPASSAIAQTSTPRSGILRVQVLGCTAAEEGAIASLGLFDELARMVPRFERIEVVLVGPHLRDPSAFSAAQPPPTTAAAPTAAQPSLPTGTATNENAAPVPSVLFQSERVTVHAVAQLYHEALSAAIPASPSPSAPLYHPLAAAPDLALVLNGFVHLGDALGPVDATWEWVPTLRVLLDRAVPTVLTAPDEATARRDHAVLTHPAGLWAGSALPLARGDPRWRMHPVPGHAAVRWGPEQTPVATVSPEAATWVRGTCVRPCWASSWWLCVEGRVATGDSEAGRGRDFLAEIAEIHLEENRLHVRRLSQGGAAAAEPAQPVGGKTKERSL